MKSHLVNIIISVHFKVEDLGLFLPTHSPGDPLPPIYRSAVGLFTLPNLQSVVLNAMNLDDSFMAGWATAAPHSNVSCICTCDAIEFIAIISISMVFDFPIQYFGKIAISTVCPSKKGNPFYQ